MGSILDVPGVPKRSVDDLAASFAALTSLLSTVDVVQGAPRGTGAVLTTEHYDMSPAAGRTYSKIVLTGRSDVNYSVQVQQIAAIPADGTGWANLGSALAPTLTDSVYVLGTGTIVPTLRYVRYVVTPSAAQAVGYIQAVRS